MIGFLKRLQDNVTLFVVDDLYEYLKAAKDTRVNGFLKAVLDEFAKELPAKSIQFRLAIDPPVIVDRADILEDEEYLFTCDDTACSKRAEKQHLHLESHECFFASINIVDAIKIATIAAFATNEMADDSKVALYAEELCIAAWEGDKRVDHDPFEPATKKSHLKIVHSTSTTTVNSENGPFKPPDLKIVDEEPEI